MKSTLDNNEKHCQCMVCLRNIEFVNHIKFINNSEAKKWFSDLFYHLNNVENDLDAYKIYEKNLQTLYPKIWREVTTINPLTKDDAEFPEIQLK